MRVMYWSSNGMPCGYSRSNRGLPSLVSRTKSLPNSARSPLALVSYCLPFLPSVISTPVPVSEDAVHLDTELVSIDLFDRSKKDVALDNASTLDAVDDTGF